MVDPPRVELRESGRLAGSTVVSAAGQVTLATAAGLRDGLVKRLVDGRPVLLDIAALQIDWAPAPEVFLTAVAAAGGWPLARLVLFGADPHTTHRLRALRVTEAVTVARDVDDAAALVDTRPARLSYSIDLSAERVSVSRARESVRDTCERWGVPPRDDISTVVDELVTSAVDHAQTPFHLRLVLDRSGLRVSVRDYSPTPAVGGTDADSPHLRGLDAVRRLSRSWGVLHYGDGKTVWVQLPLVETDVPQPSGTGRHEGLPRSIPGNSAVAVSRPRRRRLATTDPEHAQAFLRTVYGEHTLTLSGAEGPHGFHLEYDGVVSNRFAVERLTHDGAIECRFAPADAVVVVQPLEGDLCIMSRREELRVAPGEVVVCGPGTEILVRSGRLDVEVTRLSPSAVAQVTAELTGFEASSVPFDLSRPVSPARAAHWRATVAHLRRDVLGDDEVMASRLSRAMVLRNLVATLVETFPNPARDALVARTGDRNAVTPRTVRRAMAYMEEHAGDDIGLADIATAAGIGARGLQLAFRRHADLTPLEYLRRLRLGRAHRELEAASPEEATVGAIADRWGFAHHGNFSSLYLRAYGRSPSSTLRS
jgi:AraC-like DNA-binding protein/anti-sigma regulatory factor (Ser/Thr protein kinase)